MKVKAVIDICKKSKVFRFYTTEEGQWLSDGRGMYPLFGVPLLDEGAVCALYGVSSTQQEKIEFKSAYTLPKEYDFSDVVEREKELKRIPFDLHAYGCRLAPFECSSGVVYFDAAYFAPLKDVDPRMLRVYERIGASGEAYYVVKDGLFLVAILAPFAAVTEEMVDMLSKLTRLTALAVENKAIERGCLEGGDEDDGI